MPFDLPRLLLNALILLFLLIGCVHIGFATTVVIPSDDEMVIDSRAIVRGKVLSIGASFDRDQNMVFTYVTLRVHEVLKGQITSREIVLKEPGGEAAGYGSLIFGAPQFTPGEHVLVYLDTWPDGSLRVHQMFLGKFSVIADAGTGNLIAVRGTAGANVEVLPQIEQTAPSKTATDRMELEAYMEMVRQKVAANQEQSQQFEDKYYRNVAIRMFPPEYPAKASSGSLEPQFHLFNPAIRWFEPDGGQPVVFYTNLDGAPNQQVLNDIDAAMRAWSTVPGCSLRVISGGTTSQCLQSSGQNTIVFNNCSGFFSPSSGCSGILAMAGVQQYTTAVSRVIGGVVFYRALLAHMSFNPYASCYFTQHCNVAEVATHEMGHALGLHHSWDPVFGGTPTPTELEATMYYMAHFDGRCASIKTDDINGITFIYPASGGVGSELAITTVSLPAGAVGSTYSQALLASGGTPPYSWSLVSGQLPAGLGLSSAGLISGTPSSVGTFNFTVQVSDSASRTAQKALSIFIANALRDAQFVSQNVPSSVTAGQSFNFQMSWINTGSEVWSESAGIRIGSQNPPNNTTWGGNRIVLPSGLSVAPGQQLNITVTAYAPSTPGNYNFQWQMVKDQAGQSLFFGSLSTNVVINVTAQVPPLSIDSASNLEALYGAPFSFQLTGSGGTPPYTWSLAAGALPAGLSLSSAGLISGTPSSVGTFNFTVQVSDSASRTAQKTISIVVKAPPLSIVTSATPAAVKGTPFNMQLAATGGVPPYKWGLANGSGNLPPGLSLDPNTGLISGTPTTAGSFTFTIEVKDQQSVTATKSFQVTVVEPAVVPRIAKVKYKPGSGKLIIFGENFDPAAIVLVDGTQMTPINGGDSLLVKRVFLVPGEHEIRVTNPGGVSSTPFILRVD
jgi:hypothetical protein